MTSMFDQYEQASQKSVNSTANVDMNIPGYIHMKLEQDVPIFTKTKMNFTPSDKITHVAVANNYLVLAMANSMLFRIDLEHPDKAEEISLSKYFSSNKLTNIFLDPLGNHMLISFGPKNPENGSELLYLSRKSNKLKSTNKFRGHEITEVGWCFNNDSDVMTGPILLGTSKGLIFETEIGQDVDKFFQSSTLEQYWRQLFDIGKGTNTPITGIEYHRFIDKCFVFATTPTRMYYFTNTINSEEKPLLLQVFNKYLNIPEIFHSVESTLKYSRLKFWYSEPRSTPNTFGFLSEIGIIYGKLFPSNQDTISSIISEADMLDYPKPIYEDTSTTPRFPIAFALTEFHALLTYTDMIKGVSLLNHELIFEDNYNEAFGKLVNIVKDPIKGTIWAVTENAVFRYKVTKEDRNVWQMYCEKQEFELAKKYSKDNPAFYDQVLVKEADVLFRKKQYHLSAERYAETNSSFEEICLKFLQIEKQDALKLFLRKKLENIKPQDKTQITMIVLWVAELYLSQLSAMRLEGKEQMTVYFEVQKELDVFLALPQVADCVKDNKSTFYKLMASHGDKNNLIKLTIVNKDFEQVIRHHIYKNSFIEALEVLKSQNNSDLFYQFTPILIQEIPKYTIAALIDQGSKLMPVKLLPALVSYSGEVHAKEIIKYLEFCVQKLKCTEKAIHNLLLSLYASTESRHNKLMNYLAMQGQDITMVNYDVHFALRLCREKNLTKACVQLSSLLGLWESAIDLALNVDLDLAKQIANLPPQNDFEMRKKLWLKIAQHVVSGKDDIQQAMEFLQQCDLIRIEDILQFFSDFVTIDHFKDAICASLREYNQHIQDLKEEMEEATQSAELVRNDIQSFRNRATYVRANDTCSICELTLMLRPFYMFPCSHKFHTDCLLLELMPYLGPAKKNKLDDLNRQLNSLSTQAFADNVSTGSASLSVRDQVKADIDNIVASECLFCGENMIRNIDMPFIDDKDYERVMKEWE